MYVWTITNRSSPIDKKPKDMKKLICIILPMFGFVLAYSQVVRSVLRSEKIYVVAQKELYQPGDTMNIAGCVLEAHTLAPFPYSNYLNIELTNRTDSVLIRQKVKCADGVFNARIPVDYTLKDDLYYIRAYTNLMRNFPEGAFCIRPVQIGKPFIKPTPSGNYTVSFFPEGGNIVADKLQNIVFELKDETNQPKHAAAFLTNETGDTLKTVFSTTTSGLGMLSFCVEKDMKYALRMTSEAGPVSFPLPPAGNKPSLQVYVNRDVAGYRILSEQSEFFEPFRLLAFYRGICIQDTLISNPGFVGKIDFSGYPAGVASFVLADKENNPISERLVFIQGTNEQVSLNLLNDKEIYAPGESVAFGISNSDSLIWAVARLMPALEETPLMGKTDICVELLLLADVSRPIRNASLLLGTASSDYVYDFERYLYTCRWKRFPWEMALTDSFKYIYPPEEVLSLSGKIMKENGKVLTKGSVVAINNETGFTYDVPIKDNGSFTLGVDDFVEGNTFFLQGYNEKGKCIDLTVVPDNESFPSIVNPLEKILAMHTLNKEKYISDTHTSYTFAGKFDYYYDNNKSEIYRIPEIQVAARIKQKQLPTKEFYHHNFIGPEIFDNPPYPDIVSYFDRLIGVKLKLICPDNDVDRGSGVTEMVSPVPTENCYYILVTTRGVSKLGGQGEMALLVDGLLVNTDHALRTLVPGQLESIERLTPSQALKYTSFAFNGVVSIKTKGYKEPPFVSKGIHYTPIGLSDLAEKATFRFVPVTKDDIQTIKLPSASGSYQLIVEGVTSKGTPFTLHKDIKVD